MPTNIFKTFVKKFIEEIVLEMMYSMH